jgi:hypothetical protein
MTLIIGERAFANCPSLKRFGTTDTSRPDVLNIILQNGGADIQKDAFKHQYARKMRISSPDEFTIAGSAGFSNLEILNARNATVDYATVTDIVNHTIHSEFNIMIKSTIINESANITLSATTGEYGTVTFDYLNNVVSLTLASTPNYYISPYETALKLQSLTVPITYSGDLAAIMKCKSLKNLTIPYSVYPLVDLTAFRDHTQLESVTLKSGINIIQEFAFAGCTNLKNLQIGDVADTIDVTSIERGAFYKCAQLTTLKLTDRLKKIGDVAFMDSGISGEMIVPKNVVTHGVSYFLRCNNLTKLTYMCNLLEFVDPTIISATKLAPLMALNKDEITFEMNGIITINPGPADITPHTLDLFVDGNPQQITVNNNIFKKRYNTANFAIRNKTYTGIIDTLYASIDKIETVESILESSDYTLFKTGASTKANAAKITNNLNEIRDIIESYIDNIQEGAQLAATTYREIPIPIISDDLKKVVPSLITEIVTILTTAKLDTLATPINAILTNGIITPTINIFTNILPVLTKCNTDFFVNGNDDVSTPYIVDNSSFVSSMVDVKVKTRNVEDYTGESTIIKDRGGTYMRYSTITTGTNKHLAGLDLNDGTFYTVDGWFYFRMDNYFGKHHINIIEDIVSIINNGSYDNNDIDFTFIASKIIKINTLKGYKGVNISITAPAIIIGAVSMEEFTDSTISINTTKHLTIEERAFGACQAITLNIKADGNLICGSEILTHSSLITINTNKELMNITTEPIILNNIDIQYWDKSIKELLQIIQTQIGIDTSTAYNVEYTTFTSTGSINPIFAISFRTKSDFKEYNIIIPPNDYFWALSIGAVVGSAADFSQDGKYLVYYPDEAMRNTRSTEWRNGIGKMGLNTDGYGLTNNFAPTTFTFKGYTFVQKEKVNNRTLRQVCTNNEEALSERKSNKILFIFLFILEIISIITMVIPLGAIALKATGSIIKSIIITSKALITIVTRATRVGRMLVKVIDFISDGIRNMRIFVKAGSTKQMLQISRKVATCGRADSCSIGSLARLGSNNKISFITSNAQRSNNISTIAKSTDDAAELLVDIGDNGLNEISEVVRSTSIKVNRAQKVVIKCKHGDITKINNNMAASKHTSTLSKTVIRAPKSTPNSSVMKILKGKTFSPVQAQKDYINAVLTFAKNPNNAAIVKSAGLTREGIEAVLLRSGINISSRNISAGTKLLTNNITCAIRFPSWKKWAIGIGVSSIVSTSIAIGSVVGVTNSKRSISRNIVDDSVTEVIGLMNEFEKDAINAQNSSEYSNIKSGLIIRIVELFRRDTYLSQTDATQLVTSMIDYISSDDSSESYDYYEHIISLLTEIINKTENISSEEAAEILNKVISVLNNDASSLNVHEKIIEKFASANKIYGPKTVAGTAIQGFNDFSVKHIAMYNILNNIYTLGIPPTSEFTDGGLNAIPTSDPASMILPSSMDELIQNTQEYIIPPYVNPQPFRTRNIHTIEDTYSDGLDSVVVDFNSGTTVSYSINNTWKSKFDVSIDRPGHIYIFRKGILSNISLDNVRFIRIISPSFGDWISGKRTYSSPYKIEYCIEPPTWLALETYIGLGTQYQQDLYTGRDNYGHINGPPTTANPLLLSDNYMWDYTKLRPISEADNDNFAPIQIPYVETNGTITFPINDLRHKSGLFMGWNSVKYELYDKEDSIVNTALGSASDIVINYVGSTGTTIPAYAYSSSGITPMADTGPFSIAGVTLPKTLTSIGNKAFYRSGINYAIIPSSVKSIATQAFAESGLTYVKFIDSANIKMMSGGRSFIYLGSTPPQYTDLYQASSLRGRTVYNRGDVMIMNPRSVSIDNIVYHDVKFLLMLRAKIINYDYVDYSTNPAGNTIIGTTIFDSPWVNEGVASAEAYIISSGSSIIETIYSLITTTSSELTVDNNTSISYNIVSRSTLIDNDKFSKFSILAQHINIRNPVSLVTNGKKIKTIDNVNIIGGTLYEFYDKKENRTLITPFDYTPAATDSNIVLPTTGSVLYMSYMGYAVYGITLSYQLTIDNNTTITYDNIRLRDTVEYELEFKGGVSGIKSSAIADIVIKKPVFLVLNGDTFTSIDELRIKDASIFVFDYRDSSVYPLPTLDYIRKTTLFDYNTSRDSIFNPPTSGSVNITGKTCSIITNSNRDRATPRAIEDSIDIGANAFADNTSLDTLVLPDTIRNIGDSAFAGCIGLTTINLPPFKSMGNNAFADCTGITQVSFPPNIQSLGGNIFNNCPALTTITFNGILPAVIDPGFFTSIASLTTPITIKILPQYASLLINALKNSGINPGSSSTNITLAVDTSNSTPYFPMLVGPSASRVNDTLYVYSSATMDSLKSNLAISPSTKFVSWLASGAAYDGMMMRPLGRTVRIFTTGRRPLLKYIFMNVQLISTALVPSPTDRQPYLTGWVCTWSADGIYPVL